MPRRKCSRTDLVLALSGLPITAMRALAMWKGATCAAVAVDASPEQRYLLASAVLTLHAHGHTLIESCSAVSKDTRFDIHPALLRSWCRESERLGRMLQRARVLCAEALAESTLSIVDDGSDLERDRLRIDARMILARKLDPVRWGNKSTSPQRAATARRER
jgi:hypothetical protein